MREEILVRSERDRVVQQMHTIVHGSEGVNNVHIDRPQGNSSSAALRRLRKDRPDLHTKVIDGKLSANAAAIEAGFRVKTITVRVDTAENALRPLIDKFGFSKLRKAFETLDAA